MPGPRGFSAAKINQDRGVVFWPFNGSCGQALLCIFDGHGSKGEIVSEFCMKTVPELLEAEPDELQADPPGFLTKSIIKCDELLFAGSARPASPLQP
jgi:protein phosphatase PTC2/3